MEELRTTLMLQRARRNASRKPVASPRRKNKGQAVVGVLFILLGLGLIFLTLAALVRLSPSAMPPTQAASPLDRPARIQGWLAYRENRPIGLNPDRAYPVLLEPPTPDAPLWITAVPAGVFVRGIRHAATHSVVEFGVTEGAPARGDVEVLLRQACLSVADSVTEFRGPFAAGTTARFSTLCPGGLVFVWKAPAAVDVRFRGSLLQTSASFRASGVPDHIWAQNQRVHCAPVKQGDAECPTIHPKRCSPSRWSSSRSVCCCLRPESKQGSPRSRASFSTLATPRCSRSP